MASHKSRLIIGLMSGTSLDGLDIALCRISGYGYHTSVDLLAFDSIPYTAAFKNRIKKVFAQKTADLLELTVLNAAIAEKHSQMVLESLEKWNILPQDIDCIASHGQTVFHAPKRLHHLPDDPDATLQIGDGDKIAVRTGIITLSDFRQKHIAAGGEGAPLALYGDCILFSSDTENRILLNIGGIANFTYLPKDKLNIICTDTGPGNTLIDALTNQHFNIPYDARGVIAASGKISSSLLNALMSHPFFKEDLPKTTGQELFNSEFLKNALLLAGINSLDPADLIATISAFTADAIALSIQKLNISQKTSLYVSGGGCHNPFIMERLQQNLPLITIKKTAALGINPDAKEAILFALLANETICGSGIRAGNLPPVLMGKISLPE